MRPGELETHFVQELERLYKLSASSRVRRLSLENSRPPVPPGSNVSSGPRRDGVGSAGDGTPEGRWEVSKGYSIRGLYRLLDVQGLRDFVDNRHVNMVRSYGSSSPLCLYEL